MIARGPLQLGSSAISSLHAVKNVLNSIDDTLRHPKHKYFAVFVDYTKAFDYLNRQKLIRKLEDKIGSQNRNLIIINNILTANKIIIDDGTCLSKPITQTNGVLQGDPLSPLLFNLATSDIVEECLADIATVDIFMYADDMVLGSSSKEDLQVAFTRLEHWAKDNDFTINRDKTVQMIFRKGGRVAKTDHILYGNEKLNIVNHFNYLGVRLQSTRSSFRIHIKEKAIAAIRGLQDISRPERLDLKTALSLFAAKIVPIASYGIEIIWQHLTISDLTALERVKASFLKRTLGVAKSTPSRLVYEMAREPFLIEELKFRYDLPYTSAAEKHLTNRKEKRADIWEDFYTTEAMTSGNWTAANYELRHLATRFAVHGFHHRICATKTFHTPSEKCLCELCKAGYTLQRGMCNV